MDVAKLVQAEQASRYTLTNAVFRIFGKVFVRCMQEELEIEIGTSTAIRSQPPIGLGSLFTLLDEAAEQMRLAKLVDVASALEVTEAEEIASRTSLEDRTVRFIRLHHEMILLRVEEQATRLSRIAAEARAFQLLMDISGLFLLLFPHCTSHRP